MKIALAISLMLSALAKADSFYNPWKSLIVTHSVKKGQSVKTAFDEAISGIKKKQPLEYEQFLSKLQVLIEKDVVVETDNLDLKKQPLGIFLSKLCSSSNAGFTLVDDQLKIFKLLPRDDFYFLSEHAKKQIPNEEVLRNYLKKEHVAEGKDIKVDAAVSVIKLHGIERVHENMKKSLEKIQ